MSTGIKGQKGGRSAPTVINRAYSLAQFWDGRASSLEDQAKGPIANPIEMGMTHDATVERLQGIAGYRAMFAKAFGTDEINIDRTAKAERRRLAAPQAPRELPPVGPEPCAWGDSLESSGPP